jgi:quinol monooxygenase YgiN
MRFPHLILALCALGLALARPAAAQEVPSGPVYIVTHFEVLPSAVAQSIATTREYAQASLRADGNAGFEVFQEIARPNRLVTLEVWRDRKAAEAHAAAPVAAAFRDKLRPSMLSGFGARPHSGLSIAPPKAQAAGEAVVVVTHFDVFPAGRDKAAELTQAQAEASRKAAGNIRYDVLRWDGRTNHFTLVEAWRTRAAFDANMIAPHSRDFRRNATPLEGALYDERLFRAVR